MRKVRRTSGESERLHIAKKCAKACERCGLLREETCWLICLGSTLAHVIFLGEALVGVSCGTVEGDAG
jgi:hypothetical protein